MDVAELTPQQLEDLYQALERDRLRLEEHLQLTKEGSKPVQLGTPIGRLSRMDAIQQQQMTKASRATLDVKLRSEPRLRRIERATTATAVPATSPSGTHGWCRGEVASERWR